MGILHLKQIIGYLVLCLLLGAGLVLPSAASAQTCTITNPATAIQTSVGEYGAQRDGGARSHRGVDIMIPMCTPVPNQPGCTVVPNGNSPLFKVGGYGLYTRYNCGPRVEVRYAHLNGWTAGMPSNGRSGAARPTPPHVHYEVIVSPQGSTRGGRKVDPQCVWGAHPKPANCCIGVSGGCNLGHAPADMCNQNILNQLYQNAGARGYGRGLTTSYPITAGRPPESFPATSPEKDLPECSDKDDGSNNDNNNGDNNDNGGQRGVEHEHDGVEDIEAGPQLPVAGSGTPAPDPPPTEPPEYPDTPPVDNPGTPGGDPVLTPQPPPGKEPEELSGCATDTWTAMVNQSVMETRREDILNKRYIIKPDSVFDYGCFDMMKKSIAQNAGPIFSETKKWANLPVDILGKTIIIKRELGSQSLDAAIYSIVDKALSKYRTGQFNNKFLADSTPVNAQAGQDRCNVMAEVWKAAKCKNFDDAKVFYTFEDLIDHDPREFPENMKCE